MNNIIRCHLCNQDIKNYNLTFHHFKIDDLHSVDICSDCSDKFVKWQSNIITNLFPTSALKKRLQNKKL